MQKASNIVTLLDGEDLKYVISMDNMDLNMLSPFHHRRRDEVVPLWSVKSSGSGAEYCEFEVWAVEGGDDANCENARVQRCHVCDKDVPATYWMEHRRSVEHRLCCSIADIGMERAKKQMSLASPVSSNAQSATYYCPSCSCAVDLTKRNDHETSEEHSKSVLHTKLLQSLATLYKDKNNLDDVYKDLLEIVTKDVKENNVDIKIENDENVNRDGTEKQADIKAKKEEVKSEKSSIKSKDEPKQNDVIINTASKAKLRVSFDNYQGFSTVRGHIQCLVCRKLVDDKSQHFLNIEHRMKVEVVVKDKHCIRQLDHLCNHCILCNEIIGIPETHICSQQHKNYLKKALIEEQKPALPKGSCYIQNIMAENLIKINDSNTYNYFCEACQVFFIKDQLLDHVNNDEHKNSLKVTTKTINKKDKDPNMAYCSICDTYINKTKKAQKIHFASKDHKYKQWLIEKDTKIHYHMRRLAFGYEVVCQICDIQLRNNFDEIKEHVNSDKHQSNRDIMLKRNYMENVNDNTVFCVICNESEYVIDEIQHTISKSHLTKLNDYTALELGLEELKQIINSHKNEKFNDILRINRIENYDVLYYQCKLCYKFVKKQVLFDHIFTKKHKKCLASYEIAKGEEAKEAGKVETVQYDTDFRVDDTKTVDLKQPLDKKDTSINDKDKICDTKLKSVLQRNQIKPNEIAKGAKAIGIVETVQFNNDSEVDETKTVDLKQPSDKKDASISDNVKTYDTKLKALLQINQIEDKYDTFYRCNLCDRLIAKSVDINNHISTKVHTKKMYHLTHAGSSTSTVDRSKLKLPKPIKKLHYLFEFNPADENQTKCLVCNISLPLYEVPMHRKSINHHVTYINVMESNTMFRIKHRCFCECCRDIFKINSEYIHLTSERHRLNLSRNTERMDEAALQELSMNMFYEDVGVKKKVKSDEKYAKLTRHSFARNSSGLSGECRLENLKSCSTSNSFKDLRSDNDEEDNSVSDSSDGFVSARSSISSEEMKIEDDVLEESVMSEAVDTAAEITKSISYLFEKTDNPLELICKLCHSVVDNRIDMVLDHIDGLKHAKKYESILLINDLQETIDNRTETILNYRCKACGITVENLELFVHINSNKHKLYLTAKPSTSGCFQQPGEQKDAKVEPKQTEQVINDENNKIKVVLNSENLHKLYLMKYNNSNELYCKLCVSEFSDADLNGHIKSRTHQTNFEFYLLENEVKRVGVTFFCSLCKVGLAEGTEIGHLYGDKHKDNKANYLLPTSKIISKTANSNKTNGHICTVCDVEILNIPKFIKIHNDSILHIINLTKAKKGQQMGIDDFKASKSSSLNPISSISGKVQSTAVQKTKYICKVCNVEVPNNPNDIKIHNDSILHKNNLTKAKKGQQIGIDDFKASKSSSLNPISSISGKVQSTAVQKTKYICKVCNVEVPNNPNNIKIHNNGRSHKSKLPKPKVSVAPPLSNPSESKTTTAPPMGKLGNSKTAVTQSTLKLTESNPMVALPLSSIRQSKPAVAPPFSNLTISTPTVTPASLATSSSVKPVSSTTTPTLNKPAILNYVENGFCHVCKINVENNIESIRNHLKTKTHNETLTTLKLKLKENKAQTKQNQSRSSSNVISNSEINSKESNNKINVTNAVSTVSRNNVTYIEEGFCHACKMKVPNNINNIGEHVRGKNHIQNVNIIKSNANKKLQIKSNQNLVHPPNYASSVPFVSERLEINQNQSSIADVTAKRTRSRKKKAVSTSQSNVGQDAGATINNNIQMVSTPSNTTKNKCFFECTVCKTNIIDTFENIFNHYQEPYHIQKFEKLSTEQQTSFYTQVAGFVLGNYEKAESTYPHTLIPPKNNNATTTNNNTNHRLPEIDYKSNYFCKICKSNVPNNQNNIQEHIKGAKHKKNVDELVKMSPPTELSGSGVYVCQICDSNITNNTKNIAEHFNGKKHKMNVEDLKSGKLPSAFRDSNSEKVDDKKEISEVNGSKINTQDIKSVFNVISQLNDSGANVIGSRILNSGETVDAAVASSSRSTLENVIIDSYTNEINPSCANSNESESISPIFKGNTTELGTNINGTTDASISCKSKSGNCEIEEMIALKSDDTKLKTSQLNDNNTTESSTSNNGITNASVACKSKPDDCEIEEMKALESDYTKLRISQRNDNATSSNATNLISLDIVDSRKIDDIDIHLKTDSGNEVNTRLLDNSILDSQTNLTNPISEDSNESENITNPTININTNSADTFSEIQICKSTETDTSNDIASAPSTGQDEEISILMDDNNKSNILDSAKTDQSFKVNSFFKTSNTDTNIAETSKSDDSTNDLVASPKDETSKANDDDSDAEPEPNLGFYICSVCERIVPNDQKEIKSHLTSFHHTTKLSEKKLKEKEGVLPSLEDYYCHVCDENMPNDYIAINHHESAPKHRNRFENLLAENKIKMRDEKVCYCEACDLFFSKFTVKTHIDRLTHKYLLEVPIA